MGDNEWTPIACPQCDSHRYAITQDQPPKAKCADCSHIFDIPTLPPAEEKKTRHSAPGSKTRRPNGPQTLSVLAAPAPPRQNLGAGHVYTYDVLEGGPRALIAAQHQAAKLAKKFGDEFEAEWCLTTKWLQELMATNRARARYALQWRPKFLAVVALTRSRLLGSKAAKVAYNTAKAQWVADADFERQICAAQDHAIELLHDVTMRDAIEGTCEPILWQGIPVCWVRKYDNRLRIEMLRAHMPDRFKTPGAKVSVNTGNTLNVLVVDEATRNALVEMRQESLRLMAGARISEVASVAEVIPGADHPS